MAAPAQKQYTEKPRKVLAAPYDPTADPPQAGVHVYSLDPTQPPTAHAHVYNDRTVALVAGDMIVFDAVFPDRLIAVMPLAEFEAVYGTVPRDPVVIWIVVVVALAGAGCVSASASISLVPPRPMICRDGMPLRILQHPDCTNGVCGYTCQPGRWSLKETP